MTCSNDVSIGQAAADKRKSEKGRNPVYREVFHFHTAPIVLLECLGKVKSKILSIDAEGRVAVWAYAPDMFEHQGWFRPLRTATLDLRYLSLTQLKESPKHPLPPQTPHEDILALLQPMRRRVEGGVMVETFQPVRGVPHHPHKLEVFYQRRTPLPPPTSPPLTLPSWSASNVTTSLLSAGVLDVKLSPDGEEVVLLMTYEGSRVDGRGNVNLALHELQRTEEARQEQGDASDRNKRASRRDLSSQSSMPPLPSPEGGADEEGSLGSLDSVTSLAEMSLSMLDSITDSEGEDEEEDASEEEDRAGGVKRTADDFGFWMRDRELQRESLGSLALEEAGEELKGVLDEKPLAARRLSTILDHEKV